MRKQFKTFILLTLLVSSVIFLLPACQPDTSAKVQDFSYYFTRPGAPDERNKESLLEVINSSQREIVAVFNDLDDPEVVATILARYEEGVDVYVAGDFHSRTARGFADLNSAEEITVRFSDSNLDTEMRNSRNSSLPPRDGRVETNVLIADSNRCWISTSPPTSAGFNNSYGVSMSFQSAELCTDFYSDAKLLAKGGLFSDEGGKLVIHSNDNTFDFQAVSFSEFAHNKGIPDPNYRFALGEYEIFTFFAWQERPLNTLITRLLNTRNSIEFAVRAIASDFIRNKNDPAMNRSHILNTFDYKSRIPQEFGGSFGIKGVFSDELLDTTEFEGQLDHRASIHQRMASLPNTELRRNSGPITFNLYLLDKGTQNVQIILLSSDLRRRYYEDGFLVRPVTNPPLAGRQEQSMRENYYDITDAFMLIINPSGHNTDNIIFDDFSNFINEIYEEGGSL